MTEKLILAIPSKGRLKQDCVDTFARAGLTLRGLGSDRGYRGEIAELEAVDVAFVSAGEIAQALRGGAVHLGITGEDLMREAAEAADKMVSFEAKLGFGGADVVVAVPGAWIDVRRMADLEHAAAEYRAAHGRPMRVATKYLNLTRIAFRRAGVTSYRIIESTGATEGAPAAGLAELIVDITSTGETLRANKLRILDDGVILQSEANLIASRGKTRSAMAAAAEATLIARLGASARA